MVFPDGMRRVCLGLEYNGTSFRGFQKQATASRTVQAALEAALSSVADEKITLVCAGRTDAGVHASEQVVHFDTLAKRPEVAWIKGVNCSLPADIRVHWSREVGADFHARFAAQSRSYHYVIYGANTRPAVLNANLTWTPYALAMDKMQAAAHHLLGEHDFTSYRASQCQAKSPVRKIHNIQFVRHGAFVVMKINANAFLHHMVRNIIGTLIEVGRGARSVDWPAEVLLAKDRTKAAATASPCGLYLVKVEYSDRFNLPQLPIGPLFLQNGL